MRNGFTESNTNGLYNNAELDAMNAELKELYPEVEDDDADKTLVQHYSEQIMDRGPRFVVAGKTIYHDPSGIGHARIHANLSDIPQIAEEIECEIIDGDMDTCDDYIARNGVHYSW